MHGEETAEENITGQVDQLSSQQTPASLTTKQYEETSEGKATSRRLKKSPIEPK
jgi:hypothetical protein